jgi:hypothetical protein
MEPFPVIRDSNLSQYDFLLFSKLILVKSYLEKEGKADIIPWGEINKVYEDGLISLHPWWLVSQSMV